MVFKKKAGMSFLLFFDEFRLCEEYECVWRATSSSIAKSFSSSFSPSFSSRFLRVFLTYLHSLSCSLFPFWWKTTKRMSASNKTTARVILSLSLLLPLPLLRVWHPHVFRRCVNLASSGKSPVFEGRETWWFREEKSISAFSLSSTRSRRSGCKEWDSPFWLWVISSDSHEKMKMNFLETNTHCLDE